MASLCGLPLGTKPRLSPWFYQTTPSSVWELIGGRHRSELLTTQPRRAGLDLSIECVNEMSWKSAFPPFLPFLPFPPFGSFFAFRSCALSGTFLFFDFAGIRESPPSVARLAWASTFSIVNQSCRPVNSPGLQITRVTPAAKRGPCAWDNPGPMRDSIRATFDQIIGCACKRRQNQRRY